MYQKLSVLLCLFTFLQLNAAYAQIQEPKLDFGKVSEEELSMKFYDKDTSASAVILGDYGISTFTYSQNKGIQLLFTRHTRIKILKSSGYEWADIRIPLYHRKSDKELVGQLKGFTYNLVDGKIEKDKLKNDAKFSEQISNNIDVVVFTMPNVKEGSVIEYTYTITSDFLFNLRDWEFQSSIPTKWSEYEVKIPEYFKYKQLYQGYEPFAIDERTTEGGNFRMMEKTRTSGSYTTSTNYSTNELKYTAFCSRWALKEAPAITEEPYITTISDYVTKIEFELASIQIPGSVYENYTNTWETIDKELLTDDGFGDQLKRGGLVKSEVGSLTSGISDPLEKMAIIYNTVKSTYQWNGNNGVTSQQGLKMVMDEKSGNAADINLLLILMLKEAGLDANPVILSTRSHGILKPGLPMLSQFNYVVAHVAIDDQNYLMDATEPFSRINLLPVRCLNGRGRLVTENSGANWISLKPVSDSGDFFMANLSFDESGALAGTVSESCNHYLAMLQRNKLAKKSNSNDEENDGITENPQNWEVENYKIENLEKLSESIKEKYELTLTDHYQSAGDLIYLNPFIAKKAEKNPFKLEERKYPVDIPYPFSSTYILNLTMPEGYGVDEIPEDMVLALPKNGGKFIYSIKPVGNILQITSKMEINQTMFLPDEYLYLKAFYNQVVAKQSEQIVLKKN